MGRPVGSKNKKKAKEVEPEKVAKKAPIAKAVVEKNCLSCSHSEKMHYGSKDLWCNQLNCQCQQIKL